MATREQTQAKLDRLSSAAMKHTPEQSYTVADRLEERAAHTPTHPFLYWEERTFSYHEVNDRANQLAHWMLNAGVHPGETVAVMMENRPEYLFTWFALAKIGCVSALINNQVSGDALRHALATTHSRRLFIGTECAARLQSTPEVADRMPVIAIPDAPQDPTPQGCLRLDAELAAQSTTNPDATLRRGVIGSSTLCLVFTSGTTGLPKAAKITQARWLGVGEGWTALLELTHDDVFYCVLPLYHVAALMSLLSNAMACGGSVVLRRRFSASRFWTDVRAHGVTVAQYSGELCRYLYNQPPHADDTNHHLRVMTGSGLSPTIWQAFQDRFGVRQMIEGYGGTELNVGLMNLDNRIGSCGRIPFPERSNARLVRYDRENDCYIRNPDGTLIECTDDEVGEMLGMILEIPGVIGGRFDGYTDPEATEKKIIRNAFAPGDAWMRSGDLFRRDSEGYYYFVDRVGDTFRWKSENVSTMEVANALDAAPGVETITVYGVTIPGTEGRAGMATVVMLPEERFDPVAFYRLASARLPSYAVPVFVRVSEQTDITPTFKLRKVDLQKLGYQQTPDDTVWVADPAASRYVPADAETLTRLKIPLSP